MISCGIDAGSRTIKAILLRDGKTIGKAIRVAGLELEQDIAAAMDEAVAAAGISRKDITALAATGSGREAVQGAKLKPTTIGAAARGIHFLFPDVRMLIDVGAEEGRAIQCERGKATNFVINEKCAAGAGTFIESMSRTLEIAVNDFGPMALKSTNLVPMNAQCAVFAESEVVSLIHTRTAKEDIARAICDAMAGRIGSMSRRISVTPPIALAGGVARNKGFVRSLENDLKVELLIPPDPEFVCAIGVALMAGEEK
ncbi:MAG: hypothetical protein A2Z34_02685 [Planctomycetes bacterium RBG_16_59_8]|nr:MAG: hypothetical protein A2Z34_02685 [Planctomycetes bacterium RBG_16_59_8]